MARVVFTPHLRQHVTHPAANVAGNSVRELLDAVFAVNETLRGYVLDEHGMLRKHMVVFIDGHPVRDRKGLSDSVASASEVYVMQALSGG